MPKSTNNRRHVALIIETSSIYGRGLLSGIVRFMRMHDEWSVYLEQRDLAAKPPAWLKGWKGDGIISRATTESLVEAVTATGVPFVDLTDRHTDRGFTIVRSDDNAIGQLGAKHLLERGFRRFGFCGFTNEAWSERRQAAFQQAIRDAGFPCDAFRSVWQGPGVRTWDQETKHVAEWLRSIPRPFGVMACNDIRGQHVVDACSSEGFAVPEEVSILGVDNDDLLCRICDPPLTSVIANSEGVGYCAAEILSQLMQGSRPSECEYLIEPLGIAERQSTDVIAIDDPALANALQFIRKNACHGISVDDVIANSAISRSSLERKLRKYLGRTPQEEIRYVQVKRVQEMLSTTELSLEKIAYLCGFDHPEYMYVVFKRQTGKTPGSFREQVLRGKSS